MIIINIFDCFLLSNSVISYVSLASNVHFILDQFELKYAGIAISELIRILRVLISVEFHLFFRISFNFSSFPS